MKKIIIALTFLLTTPLMAAEGSQYFGVSMGTSDVDASGFDEGSSFAFSGGSRLNKNFAFEVSYIDLGDSSDNIAPVWTLKSDGFNISAVGIMPVNDKVDIFGKVGMFFWNNSVHEAGFGEFYSNSGSDLSYGFGASVNLAKQFDLVFEYQKFEVDTIDVSNMSIGARINF